LLKIDKKDRRKTQMNQFFNKKILAEMIRVPAAVEKNTRNAV